MKHPISGLVLVALVGCSGKSTDAPPAAEKAPVAAEKAPTTAEAPVDAPPAEPAPDTLPPPPKVTIPVLGAKSFGGVDGKTRLEQAAIEAALPGFGIVRFETQAEGDTYVNFGVEHAGKRIAVIGLGHAAVAVNAVAPAIRDEKGIGLGSTYARFKAAWPDAKCTFFELTEQIDDVAPFETIDCKLPASPALWYRFDVSDLKHDGDKMPPEAEITERPLTTFTADYGK